jgi:hypothetical protein
MSLKPDELADAMITALPAAWKKIKGVDFPGGSTDDAKVMFLAVARGLLTYLHDHPNDTISKIDLTIPSITAGPYDVRRVTVNTDLS